MANAYSNPQFYAQFKPVETEDWNTAIQLASFKKAEYDKGVAELEQYMSAMSSVPIDNLQAKAHFEDRVSNVLSEINRTASSEDLSKKGTRDRILATLSGAIDDTTINAMSASKAYRNYDAQWKAIQKEDSSMYSDNNYLYGIEGYNEYVNADKNADVKDFVKNGFAVVPYKDLAGEQAKMTMEMVKQKGKREYSVPIYNEAGQVVAHSKRVEVGLDSEEIASITKSMFTDPSNAKQLEINAWSSYGGYNEAGAGKLVADYESYSPRKIAEYEAQANYYQSLADSGNTTQKSEYEAKAIKYKNLAINERDVEAPKFKKALENGKYREVGTYLALEGFVGQAKEKFGTLYDNYQTGIEADELFWKQQDYNFKVTEFQYKVQRDTIEDSFKREELDLKREGNDIAKKAIGTNGDGILEVDEPTIHQGLTPYEELNKNLSDINNNRVSAQHAFIEDVDVVLSTAEQSGAKEAADKLKNLYVDHMYTTITKRGGKVNKEYMKTLSMQELSQKYGDADGTIFFAVARRNKYSLEDLTLRSGNNAIGNIEEIEKNYKEIKLRTDKVDSLYTKELESKFFNKELLSKIVNNNVNILSDNKVKNSSDLYKNILNKDGTFKSSVTQAQKNKLFLDIKNTIDLQQTTSNYTTNKDSAYKLAKYLGGTIDDVVEGKRLDGTTYYSFKTGSKANEYIYKGNGVGGVLVDKLFSKDSLLGDRTFRKEFLNAVNSANFVRDEASKKYAENQISTDKAYIIPFKVGDKPTPSAYALATYIKTEKGIDIDTDDISSVKVKQEKNGQLVAIVQHKDPKSKEIISTPQLIEKSFVQRNIPELAERLNLNRKVEAPKYSYDILGLKPLNLGIRPYLDKLGNESKINTLANGNPEVAMNMTRSGAFDIIKSQNVEAFKQFPKLEDKLDKVLKSATENFDIDIQYNFGGQTAKVSLVDKKNNRRPLIEQQIDAKEFEATERAITQAPLSKLNNMLSQIIFDTYYNTRGKMDSPSFERIFGTKESIL